jgi:ketosteroid isomerase-like protein
MDEIQQLKRQLAELTDRLRKLEDVVEIGQLVARYGPAVDSGQAKAAADLWEEDGVFDAIRAIRMEGRAQIEGMVESAGHQTLILNGCAHVLTAPVVTVEGDQARGRNYALNIRWDPAADRFWVARVSANSWTLRRTADGWRVKERINWPLDGEAGPRDLLGRA